MSETNSHNKKDRSARRGTRRLVLLIVCALLFVVLLTSFGYKTSRGEKWQPLAFLTNLFASPTLPTQSTISPEVMASLISDAESRSSGQTPFIVSTASTEAPAAATTPPVTSVPASEDPESLRTEESADLTSEPSSETEEASDSSRPGIDVTDLAGHLAIAGLKEEELVGTQLIVCQGLTAPACMLFFFEKTEDGWVMTDALSPAHGTVADGGLTTEMSEEVSCTPIGYFSLGPAYGAAESAITGLEYHQLKVGDYWIDDPHSKYYNTLYHIWQNDKDWTSAEDMGLLAGSYYKYCILIGYNTDPIIPGAGSAIFLHVEVDPATNGCVATSEAVMFSLFGWLRADADPHILIYDYEADPQ